MSKELIVSSTAHETKVAVLESDELVEVFFERERQYGLAGSIYKGRVTRVLPGMQSAFVNIGLDRDAFLYVSDFFEDNEEYDRLVTTAEEKVLKLEEKAQLVLPDAAAPADSPEPRRLELRFEPRPDAAPPASEAEPLPELPPRYIDPPDRFPGGRRRGRGRRRGGRPGGPPARGFPDSKFANRLDAPPPRYEPRPELRFEPRADARPEPLPESEPEPFFEPIETAEPVGFEVLPGESLAKYSRPTEETEFRPTLEPDPEPIEESSLEELRLDNRLEHSIPDLESEPSRDREGAVDPDLLRPPAEEQLRLDNRLEHSIPDLEPEPSRDPEGAVAPDLHRPPSEAAAPPTDLELQSEPEPDPEPDGEPPSEPAPAPTLDAEPPSEGQPLEASVREQPSERRYLQRNHRLRRGRGGRGRERTDRPERTERTDRVPRAPDVADELPTPPRLEANITDLLKPGQEILVQIAKEPLGKKGARITSHIALPGRYLVYMPTVDHVGVSRKIQSDDERLRLKRVVQGHRTGMPGGFIVRTAGEGHTDDEIRADMDFLYNLWLDLRATAERRPAPALIHHDLHLVERILRDQLTETFKTLWVDSQDDYERILQFVERFQAQLVGRVKLYTRSNPIFDEFGITQELEKALRPKVWLKSGGYIVINQTEALVAIDVNTGKYVGKSNRLEDTIVKTNIDAVKEIVRQIRLRDLGGIIVVDFIDMDERKNRQKVMQALDEALREDRSPSKILQFNDFGLVAITRKRVKQSLERTLCAPCPYCDAAGYVKSVETMVLEILTEAKKIARQREPGEVTLRVNPDVGKVLKSRDNSYLEELETILGRSVLVKSDPQLHQEKFDFN
jgi:ribonuclease G